MKHSSKHDRIEFIHNPDFVVWVLKPTDESDQYWKTYISENPLQKKEFEQAGFLIKGLVHHQKLLSEIDVSILWDKIKQSDISRKRRFINLKRWSAAASVILLIGISGWLVSQRNTQKINETDYRSISVNVAPGNDIKLILSDRSEKTFTAKEVELKYDQKGMLVAKSGKQVETENLRNQPEAIQMNQLIIPRGKRSSVELSDGTKLWLNSGSRVIYPVVFNGKNREIYIEGEGYLEVAHDATRPFYVMTDQIKVKVLGTKFNISAYKDDDHVSVVLVEGSIQASVGSENRVIKPNQILNFEKLTQRLSLKETNVLEYISWVDGWMLCNKEQISSIATKLSRYYDVKISHNDPRINNMTLTGKLDLKSNYGDVLNAICTTAPLKYEMIDNTIYLTMKE